MGRLNDGVRISDNGNSTRWRGSTFPTEITIGLDQAITLSAVNIIGQQDVDSGQGVEPAMTTSCGRYAVAPVDIEYWNGDSWQPGASLSDNGKVWVQWSPEEEIVTDRIRLIYDGGRGNAGNYLRLAELEVYGVAEGDKDDDIDDLTNFALQSNGGAVTGEGGSDGAPENCIDGEIAYNNGKRWRSNNGEGESSLTFTLDGAKEIHQIDLITQQPDSVKTNGQYPAPTLESETNACN